MYSDKNMHIHYYILIRAFKMQENKIDNFNFKHYLYVIIHSFSHVLEHLASQHQVAAIEWLQPGQLRQIPRHTTDALAIPQT